MSDFKNCTATDSFQRVLDLQGIIGRQVWQMIQRKYNEIKWNGIKWNGIENEMEWNENK